MTSKQVTTVTKTIQPSQRKPNSKPRKQQQQKRNKQSRGLRSSDLPNIRSKLLNNARLYALQLRNPNLYANARFPDFNPMPSTMTRSFQRISVAPVLDSGTTGDYWTGLSLFPWINGQYSTLTALSVNSSENWSGPGFVGTVQTAFVANFALMRCVGLSARVIDTTPVTNRNGIIYVGQGILNGSLATLKPTINAPSSEYFRAYDLAAMPSQGLTFTWRPLYGGDQVGYASNSDLPTGTCYCAPLAAANQNFIDNCLYIIVNAGSSTTYNMSGLVFEVTYLWEAIPFQSTAELFDLKAINGSQEVLAEALMEVDAAQGINDDSPLPPLGSGDTDGNSANRFLGYAQQGADFMLAHSDTITKRLMQLWSLSDQWGSSPSGMNSFVQGQIMEAKNQRSSDHVIEQLKTIQREFPQVLDDFCAVRSYDDCLDSKSTSSGRIFRR
jgi:hypothetical protein